MSQLPEIWSSIRQNDPSITDDFNLDAVKLQLIKDFNLCGITVNFDEHSSFDYFLESFYATVYQLVQYRFDHFLQLLYRIDVTNQWSDQNKVFTSEEVAQMASVAILKRTIQKIKWRKEFDT